MTIISVTFTGGRATIVACAALVFTATAAGCAHSNTGTSSTTRVVRATTTSSAVVAPTSAAATTAGTDGELSVGETPWWQLPSASPPNPASSAVDPPPQRFVLSGGVLFEPNSPVLTAGAGTQLGVILAKVLAHPGSRLAINGYTNSDGGPENTAVTLSAARAGTVKAWFIANGIPAARITTHGWGDSHPVYAHPTTDAERAANRRCEITVSADAP